MPEYEKTVKGVLAVIEDFLTEGDANGEGRSDLWDILTALRGPDNGNEEAKLASTSILRFIALGRAPAGPSIQAFVNGKDDFNREDFPLYGAGKYPDLPTHFKAHTLSAFDALQSQGITREKDGYINY